MSLHVCTFSGKIRFLFKVVVYPFFFPLPFLYPLFYQVTSQWFITHIIANRHLSSWHQYLQRKIAFYSLSWCFLWHKGKNQHLLISQSGRKISGRKIKGFLGVFSLCWCSFYFCSLSIDPFFLFLASFPIDYTGWGSKSGPVQQSFVRGGELTMCKIQPANCFQF